jgi:DNA-binding Xre family transcriptional regulator
MPFSFNPLWKLLIDKGMTKEKLRIALKFSPSTIAKMSKGENVSMDVIDKICEYFNVPLNDIVEYVAEKKE